MDATRCGLSRGNIRLVSQNPLIAPWSGPYGGVPPWDRMAPEHFPGAFTAAIAEQRDEITAIVGNGEPPTFENTIVPLERAGRMLDRIERMFGVARESVTNAEYQALERDWQPVLAGVADEVLLNGGLFQRIKAVYEALPASAREPDQRRLVTRIYERFVRQGAELTGEKKQRLSEINQELAALFAEFRAKVLADENTSSAVEDDQVIVNTRSSVDPYLRSSPRRDLREIVWRKFKSRGANGDANDTTGTITAVVNLRAERARLLGFASHAHWRMADTMAADPAEALTFMLRVWPAVVARVKAEVAEMQELADLEGAGVTIEPWDFLYYAEKVRKAKYDLDEAEITPYFELDNMVAAVLWSADRRFGISFREITGTIPVFHPDVRVWEVVDTATGAHRAILYLDNFARPGKRSGAWETSYRSQHTMDRPVTAIASINNNFVKGAPGEPVLLTYADAKTLFHEFGHALHTMLQDIRYPGLELTPMDYVELPSQLNERWLLDRELLNRFARHYETGDPIPQALVEKIERSSKFSQGYATLEYLSAAIVDMDLHTRPEGVEDITDFEREALERVGGMPREVVLRHRLTHFDHLFGNDIYSAGYYSYLWSDVMAADAWLAFVEAGGAWDAGANQRFRTHILADGNSIDRAEAYRRFRGRDPDIEALLEARGFSNPQPGETVTSADY
jgi:peptidyl-dipeptidase Dcp